MGIEDLGLGDKSFPTLEKIIPLRSVRTLPLSKTRKNQPSVLAAIALYRF
ncbi:MAG: hypothetical protein ICV86_08015 [Microcoleus sp. T3-bin5]|nr:hypothetical protein [Microcoleus sp. T3-bin5]